MLDLGISKLGSCSQCDASSQPSSVGERNIDSNGDDDSFDFDFLVTRRESMSSGLMREKCSNVCNSGGHFARMRDMYGGKQACIAAVCIEILSKMLTAVPFAATDDPEIDIENLEPDLDKMWEVHRYFVVSAKFRYNFELLLIYNSSTYEFTDISFDATVQPSDIPVEWLFRLNLVETADLDAFLTRMGLFCGSYFKINIMFCPEDLGLKVLRIVRGHMDARGIPEALKSFVDHISASVQNMIAKKLKDLNA
jgi:hypothetical protein